MILEDLNITGDWILTIVLSIMFITLGFVLVYGILVVTPEQNLEKERVGDLSCGDLKYYILDDGRYKELAKEKFIWGCEK